MRPATKDALASIDVLTRSALAAGRALTSDERNGTALVMNSADVGRVFLRTDVRVDSGVTGDQFQRNLSACGRRPDWRSGSADPPPPSG